MNQDTQNSNKQEFTKPRHWQELEELTPEYWADDKAQEVRGQEFAFKPIEALEKMGGQEGVKRREFLTLMGASMAMASLSCARRPVHKIIPYVVKPEQVTPGLANYYASTCGECSTGCGILAKVREGRPIKLEGNPDHEMNQGKLCGKGQASLLGLYDPDRLRNPMVSYKGQQPSKRVSWNEVDDMISKGLGEAASKGGRVRVLTGAIHSETRSRLIREFLSGFRDGKHVEADLGVESDIAEGQRISYGRSLVPRYEFDQANVVVSLGADFLGQWASPVEHARTWAAKRKLEGQAHPNAKMSKFYCFEAVSSITGAAADERFGVRTGDELRVALALASELTKLGASADAKTRSLLGGFAADKVAASIGGSVTADKIREVAKNLWSARGKSLVVGGGMATRTDGGVGLQVAVNLLNSMLGNDGKTVTTRGGHCLHSGSHQSMADLVGEMKAGKVDVLIVHGVNPSYTHSGLGMDEALGRVRLVIHVSQKEDETAEHADFVLPDHHYLENWGDTHRYQGMVSLQQPTIAPIYSSRAFEDNLLAWIRSAKLRVSGTAASVAYQPKSTWHDYLKSVWKSRYYTGGKGFQVWWEEVLQKGVHKVNGVAVSRGGFRSSSLDQVSVAAEPKKVTLALYPNQSMGSDGHSANNAWLQELPDPMTTATWDNFLSISPALAKSLKVKTNDVVDVTTEGKTVFLPVMIQPGMHAKTAAVAVGYGRRRAGRVGTHVGVDVFPLVKDGQVFSGREVTLKKTGRRYEVATTQVHHRMENRPIVNDVSLDEYKANPNAESHTNPHMRAELFKQSMWPAHEYKGNRWGMSIDLNSCTGCGSCVMACQSENNVPVVGRDQVRVGREMHWIRLDRYYSGSEDNPEVVFQPMICQHCENASCETVCPVLATVHDNEGLNEMVYNRCVGTRYCQNNCPYKVRRFNFFDHWKDKMWAEPANLAWNPDVTVRSRGIMEKCSFCIQRIQEAKGKAKGEGRALGDGEFKTACQQTCPTDAIVFGNTNDAQSQVSKLWSESRGFKVIEVAGNKPQVTYQTKVRNRPTVHHDAHSHAGDDHGHS